MLHDRFRRIALPFLLFWPLIGLGVGTAALLYVHVMLRGRLGFDLALVPHLQAAMAGKPALNTVHLWFLVQLWWLALLGAGLVAAWQSWGWRWLPLSALHAASRRMVGSWWGPAVLVLPLAVVGSGYPDGVVLPRGALWPPLTEWLHNGIFFGFGAALFGVRGEVLPRYGQQAAAWLLAGVPFFLAAAALVQARQHGVDVPLQAFWAALTYNAATWCWSLGLIGLFLRALPAHHPVLAYLSDSAYAVYLLHLVATVGFGALLFNTPLGAGWKMAANVALTTAVCLLAYQTLVRRTWVGRLLNGGRAVGRTAHS